jgi:hypothetical protein
MCYHRRLHFILCNHIYDLEIMRPCPTALALSSPSPSLDNSSSSSSSSAPEYVNDRCCRTMTHPLTTYKVRRVCRACEERRGRLDERVREVRERLEGVRERVAGMRLFGESDGGEGEEKDDEEKDEQMVRDEVR